MAKVGLKLKLFIKIKSQPFERRTLWKAGSSSCQPAAMEAAWQEIKNHPKVRLSLDLCFFGVVFFRKEQKVKEHFTLIKWTWKPWAVGVGDFFG